MSEPNGSRGEGPGDRHKPLATLPPIEPDCVVALVWAAMFAFSGSSTELTGQRVDRGGANVKGQGGNANAPTGQGSRDDVAAEEHKVGKDAIELMKSMPDRFPQNGRENLYLIHLDSLFLDSLRSLSNRVVGMMQYFQLSLETQKASIDEAHALGSVSGNLSSWIPRIGATAGGVSIAPVLTKVANAAIPSFAGISGYELALFGGFVGYFAVELLLRYYSYWAVPRAIRKGQRGRHHAYNSFLREAKQVLTNLAYEAVALREQFYPEVGTLGKVRFFHNADADEESRGRLAACVVDLVERVTPIVHDDVEMGRGSRFKRTLSLSAGDLLIGSYSVEDGSPIECSIMKEGTAAPVHREVSAAGELRLVAETGGAFDLVFVNPSRFRRKRTSYGVQILGKETVDFLPRNSIA